MTRKRLIVAGLICVAVCLGTVARGEAQTGRAVAPVPKALYGGGFGLNGGFPNAGSVLEGPYNPPVNVLYGLKFDLARRWVWAGTEASMVSAGQPDIYILDHRQSFQVISTLVTDELRSASSPVAQIDGPVDELALLGNGDLLCADYNGDLTRFDDTLFLLNPTSPPTLKGVWYLDDLGCPGSCAANGNTNNPRDRVDALAGLAVRRTFEINASNQATQEIFVGQYMQGAVIRQIELTPGTPGTWATRRTHLSPTGDSVDGIDWDPEIQAFWMASTGTGMIYEVALDTLTNTFRVIQAFKANGVGGAIAVTSMTDTEMPHKLIEGEGFSFTGSIHVLDTGRIGRGTPAVYDAPGPGPVQVGVLLDQDCANMRYRLLVSLSAGAIPIGDRYLQLGFDPLLYWSVVDPQFEGVVDPSGVATFTLPVNPPPNFGPLYFAFVVFGSATEDYLGIKRITRTVPHLVQ